MFQICSCFCDKLYVKRDNAPAGHKQKLEIKIQLLFLYQIHNLTDS